MTISVIMPAFNADRFIEAAIQSLLRERDDIDLDIIVIDDGSTDHTPAVVESFALDFPEVRLLRNPRKGIAAARNTGLDNVSDSCKFVTFLDADDICYPGRIQHQQSMLVNDPTTDVIYGRMIMFRSWDDAKMTPAAGSPTQTIRGPYLQSSIYRPAVIEKVGRFDETYSQGDDTDFVLRVIEHGFRIVLDDSIAAYYRRHDSNVTLDLEQRQREFMRASLKWAVRHRLSGKTSFPSIYSDLFLKVGEIERDFDG